jgi:hypothetical protein
MRAYVKLALLALPLSLSLLLFPPLRVHLLIPSQLVLLLLLFAHATLVLTPAKVKFSRHYLHCEDKF